MTDKEHKYPVIEIFGPTIQGEGLLLGVPTHFLRLGGCGYNCTWCDSMHAVDPAQIAMNRTMMTLAEITSAIDNMAVSPWVTLTGGDPCIHKGLEGLLEWSRPRGIRICVETQGEMWPEWLQEMDVVTFSPKGPSSGNITLPEKFVHKLSTFRTVSNAQIAVKIVCFDGPDVKYATEMFARLAAVGNPYQGFYYQVGSPLRLHPSRLEALKREYETTSTPEMFQMMVAQETAAYKQHEILSRYRDLVEYVLHKGFANEMTHITPQMHTLLWPNEEKGR
jgi:7-carboxy-7-deazaguanine synthase